MRYKYPNSARAGSWRHLFVCASVLALAFQGASASYSAPKTDGRVLVGNEAPEPLRILSTQDIAAATASMGLSVEEVTNKFLGQDNFSAAVASIEASDPNFSKAEWTGGSGPKGIISFAGKPSSDSRKTLRSLPFKVELRTDEKLSATSQSAALEEAFSKFSTLDGVANPTGYIDQTTNTIQLQHAEIPSEEMPGTDLV